VDAVLGVEGRRPATGATLQGSGCCVDRRGYGLVTAHQVTGVEHIEGRLRDGTTCRLSPVEIDEERELALLKADQSLPAAAGIGDATSLQGGAPLLSIAAPANLDFSAVPGTVSSTNRKLLGFPVIQAVLTATRGSSGGPVFDRDGALVGLISGRFEEVDFTIVNAVNNAYPMLRRHGILRQREVSVLEDGNALIPAAGITETELRAVQAYNAGVAADRAEEKARHYRTATQLLPGFFEAWFNLGVAYAQAGALEQAAKAYRKAAATGPGSVKVNRNLGRVLLERGDFAAAEKAFRKALTLAPGSAQSYNDLGVALREQGRANEAAEAFREALARDPGYAPAHYNLALLLAGNGAPAEAVKHFERFMALRPNAEDRGRIETWIEELQQESQGKAAP